MDNILLKTDGRILSNGKEIKAPIGCLSKYVELEKGYKLLSFFKMINVYKELIEISEVLESLIEIVDKTGLTMKTEIESLLFYKTIEMKGFPGKSGIYIYNSLKGVTDKEIKDLKFFHLEMLLNCELKLGDLNHVVFGDKEDVLSFETFYTLFEIVEGIAWQLSFNFNPLQCSIRR
ncbi:MAG: hypothetical protein GY714_27375 [Desulfobacterales bacterium]|nr:hypothetical protein [Desulfobacterales bacterium]MCP4163431.1 hypothetical protein [Deltaproteobacteria bacterium]